MPVRTIVLDANILIRFVLGAKVPALLSAYAAAIDFLAPDTAFEEARKHVPMILRARGEGGTGEAEALDVLIHRNIKPAVIEAKACDKPHTEGPGPGQALRDRLGTRYLRLFRLSAPKHSAPLVS